NAPFKLMLAQADGTYAALALEVSRDETTAADSALLVVDINGDGMNDLLTTKGGASTPTNPNAHAPQLYLNLGDGRFERARDGIPAGFTTNAGAAAAVDFNRDGRLDVFVGGRALPGEYP